MQARTSDSEITRLREAREAAGVTLDELAEMSGYAIGTISSVENGHDRPSRRYVDAVVSALRISPEWMKSGKGPLFKDSTRALVFDGVYHNPEHAARRAKMYRDWAADLNRQAAKIELELKWFQDEQAAKAAKPKGSGGLTDVTLNVTNSPVTSALDSLIESLRVALGPRGSKARLARELAVPRSHVSQWLAGSRKPSSQTLALLQQWVARRGQ